MAANPREVVEPNTIDSYKTLMDVAWNFDYEAGVPKIEDLYRRAKDNQWNADNLKWDTPIDPASPYIRPEHSVYYRMPWFKKLSKTQQETFDAHSTAQLLSQFLHGEQGALLTAATIAHGVPDVKAKYYAATQAMDEARHVEVYERYVKKIAIDYPMTPWLKDLIDATLKTQNYMKVMIGMNMVVEGLALGAFNNMYKQTDEPLLKSITFNVMRDESRHVSFGHVFLTPLIAKMHTDEVEDLAQFAYDAVMILVRGQVGIDKGFLRVLEVSGIDVEDFTKGMKEAETLGIARELPPGQIHSLKDLMMPALIRAGLVTKRTRQLFVAAGVPVDADQTILNRMEDQKSDMNVLNAAGARY